MFGGRTTIITMGLTTTLFIATPIVVGFSDDWQTEFGGLGRVHTT